MSFRLAVAADEELFWYWRERSERAHWYDGPKTTRADHGQWFRDRLDRITMLVWSFNGEASGTVRVDSNGEVAFDTHPSLMTAMLRELMPYASDFGRFKVTVDRGDKTKARALEAAGFEEFPVRFFGYRP